MVLGHPNGDSKGPNGTSNASVYLLLGTIRGRMALNRHPPLRTTTMTTPWHGAEPIAATSAANREGHHSSSAALWPFNCSKVHVLHVRHSSSEIQDLVKANDSLSAVEEKINSVLENDCLTKNQNLGYTLFCRGSRQKELNLKRLPKAKDIKLLNLDDTFHEAVRDIAFFPGDDDDQSVGTVLDRLVIVCSKPSEDSTSTPTAAPATLGNVPARHSGRKPDWEMKLRVQPCRPRVHTYPRRWLGGPYKAHNEQ